MTLLAASLWVALHLTEAVRNADQHRSTVALTVAVVLALALAGFALAPLLSSRAPQPLDPRVGGVVAAAAAAMVLCVHPFLTPDGLSGYANWPMGEIGVLVASLVLREEIGLDRIVIESDYPHADSTWPDTSARAATALADLPADEAERICWRNAADLFSLDAVPAGGTT